MSKTVKLMTLSGLWKQ